MTNFVRSDALSSLPSEYLTALKARIARKLATNRLPDYRPYPKQAAFHKAGARYRQRAFFAGNQLGKTTCGAAEFAFHLTGDYPAWWEGRRWNRPVRAWAGSKNAVSVRDGVQRHLLGPIEAIGTGMIPGSRLGESAKQAGVPDAYDFVLVLHKSGGWSYCKFKSYDQGREAWQVETLDLVWLDEEPPEPIFSEATARGVAVDGVLYLTATPLLGMSVVVRKFWNITDDPSRTMVRMEIDEAEHIPADEREAVIALYPEHERDARARGIPVLGSGQVFAIEESRITKAVMPEFPRHWPRICGIDFGWDHPFAAVWLAHDPDTETTYVYDAFRVRKETPIVNAAAIKARGAWIPVAWPADGLQTRSGFAEAAEYRSQGLNMLPIPAQFDDKTTSVEAGVIKMLDRMKTNQFYVAAHLKDWFEEFRTYHRQELKIVKEHDDLLSATRYAFIMLRYAQVAPTTFGGDESERAGGWMGA